VERADYRHDEEERLGEAAMYPPAATGVKQARHTPPGHRHRPHNGV